MMRRIVLSIVFLALLTTQLHAGLYERLVGTQEPKIAVHQFMALLAEVERGKITAGNAASILGLDAAEQTEATTLISKIVTPLESISLGAFVQLSNVGTSYDAISASQGLPMFRIQTAGINQFEFTVRVNKVGSGTQSWQLWNETDGTEITVIDDAGASGVKTLSTTHTFGLPLGAGFKTIRVRAKSTTGADDPIYLGGALLIKRVDRLTAEELHQILLMAEYGYAPYDTVAEVKARLGVP